MELDKLMELNYPTRRDMREMIYGQKERADKLQTENKHYRDVLEKYESVIRECLVRLPEKSTEFLKLHTKYMEAKQALKASEEE